MKKFQVQFEWSDDCFYESLIDGESQRVDWLLSNGVSDFFDQNHII